jgi:acyl carrier protein
MIEEKKFLEVFASIFDETESSEITMDTEFKELPEWSSLVTLSAIVAMEENFKKTLTAKDIESSKTIADIYNLINQQV